MSWNETEAVPPCSRVECQIAKRRVEAARRLFDFMGDLLHRLNSKYEVSDASLFAKETEELVVKIEILKSEFDT